jgi:hypothetical protein
VSLPHENKPIGLLPRASGGTIFKRPRPALVGETAQCPWIESPDNLSLPFLTMPNGPRGRSSIWHPVEAKEGRPGELLSGRICPMTNWRDVGFLNRDYDSVIGGSYIGPYINEFWWLRLCTSSA